MLMMNYNLRTLSTELCLWNSSFARVKEKQKLLPIIVKLKIIFCNKNDTNLLQFNQILGSK
jgi:hypothetical protein